MESLLEKTPIEPVAFQAWFDTLTTDERRLVTKARRQGLIVMNFGSDGNVTVGKASA